MEIIKPCKYFADKPRLEKSSSRRTYTTEFSAAKRFQLCKQAFKVMSEWHVKFLNNDPVKEYKNYVLNSNLAQAQVVRAFECPTDPRVYLEITRHVQDEYTAWIIIEQPQLPTSSDETDMTFRIKYVTDITKGN